MIEYSIQPERLIEQLVRDHGAVPAARRLSMILENNDKARVAFARWAIARAGQVVEVPHLGKVK